MRVALNITDLDSAYHGNEIMANLLLGDFCSQTSPLAYAGREFDATGVILDGPASKDESRVIALVELLQTSLGPRKIGRRIRCYYQNSKGNWTEIRPNQNDWPEKARKAARKLAQRLAQPHQMALL